MATRAAVKTATRHLNGVDRAGGELDSKVVLRVLAAVQRGDFSARMPSDWTGSAGKVAAALNAVIESNERLEHEIRRLNRHVGKEGQVKRAGIIHSRGAWASTLEAGNLTSQVRNIAEVTTAVQKGDLSKKITVDVRGEILELKQTINTMVDQLNAFASEVTRVAREVGTEGKLGGQADVRGVGGIWKDLTENVNLMAGNLTSQVRNIAEVTTGIANGDLSKKITVDVRGEILELKQTINTMVDQLNAFANEVTRVAREVSSEGHMADL